MLIVTSVKNIEEFYYNATIEEREPQNQLFRRFKAYIKLDNEFANYYYFDFNTMTYLFDRRTVNPISLIFNREIDRKYTDKLIKAMDSVLPFGADIEEYQQQKF